MWRDAVSSRVGVIQLGAFSGDLIKFYRARLGDRGSRASKLKLWLLNSELHAVACYRFGQLARRLRSKNRTIGTLAFAMYQVWNRWTTHVDHIDISSRAEIGPGLFLMHRHGIIIGPCRIGRNCLIHQNVTIGQRVAGRERAVPQIGDNVWIGPGAVISGGISIGDGTTISAGTVLSKDVPPRSLVGGNPGRIIGRDYDNSTFLSRLPDDL